MDAGKVTLTPKGTWDSTKQTTYEFLDMVTHVSDEEGESGTYVACKNVPVNIAITNTTYWMKMVDGGGGSAQAVILTSEEYEELPDSKLTDGVIYIVTDIDSDPNTVVYLTQSQYDALPNTKLTDGKWYVITDANSNFEIDDVPTENSENPVSSGGVYDTCVKYTDVVDNLLGEDAHDLPLSAAQGYALNASLAQNIEWTPIATDDCGDVTIRSATATKVGKLVFLSFTLNITTTNTGTFDISLPIKTSEHVPSLGIALNYNDSNPTTFIPIRVPVNSNQLWVDILQHYSEYPHLDIHGVVYYWSED